MRVQLGFVLHAGPLCVVTGGNGASSHHKDEGPLPE